MNPDRRRLYLAALDIPLWLPRRPVAIAPLSLAVAATVALPANPTRDSGAMGAEPSTMEPSSALRRASAELWSDPASAALLADDDWMPPMDDNWELMPDTGDENIPPTESRAARIARLDWDALGGEVRQCTACNLCESRTQTVFGVGNRQADWLIVGEAPGADEDRQGEPFVGRAGKLLNPMLEAIGLKREQVFIANILKCRPPDNRDPAPAEAASCRPFLERQIALIQPRIILAVGRIAAQNLLNTDTPIGKLRGEIHFLGAARIPLVVTYHPAYLLRSPREKRKSWDDLRLARRALTAAPSAAT